MDLIIIITFTLRSIILWHINTLPGNCSIKHPVIRARNNGTNVSSSFLDNSASMDWQNRPLVCWVSTQINNNWIKLLLQVIFSQFWPDFPMAAIIISYIPWYCHWSDTLWMFVLHYLLLREMPITVVKLKLIGKIQVRISWRLTKLAHLVVLEVPGVIVLLFFSSVSMV
jgi:hypothetical protein